MSESRTRPPLPRSAPKDWGAWPPSQKRVNTVVERAVRRIAELIAHESWVGGTILMAQPVDASSLDCSYVGTEEEVCVGHVRAIGQHKGWRIYWAPATNEGRIRRIGHYDWEA